MSKIEDLKNLRLEKIGQPALRKAIEKLLQDYEAEENKEMFVSLAQGNIDKLYTLVKENASESIEGNEGKQKKKRGPRKKRTSSKPKENPEADEIARKEKSKKVMEEVLDTVSQEIEACRRTIREFNRQRREVDGKKPPVKKSRLTKLKEKLLSIAGMIPDNLKEDKDVRDRTERVLTVTLKDLTRTWGMNKIKAAQDAIKSRFDELDQKHELTGTQE